MIDYVALKIDQVVTVSQIPFIVYCKEKVRMLKKNIWVSGLMNIETTVKVKKFPIEYFPIDYPFFGINSSVSGVGVNVVKALKTLDNNVTFASMIGNDYEGEHIIKVMENEGIDTSFVRKQLKATPASVILYDEEGKRQIYCDLKDIQDTKYPVAETGIEAELNNCDIAILCNANFNRDIIKYAKNSNALIATDVHVLEDIHDEYNKEFMENADILFLSDEKIKGSHKDFVRSIADAYNCKIIVLGMGSKGAMMYVRDDDDIIQMEAVENKKVVNTVGAGDALFSAFINYYAKGFTPQQSLYRAQVFASYKVGFNGAACGFANEEQMQVMLSQHLMV